MNVVTGIRLKIDPNGLQQKYISDDCLRSVCEAATCRIFAKRLGKET